MPRSPEPARQQILDATATQGEHILVYVTSPAPLLTKVLSTVRGRFIAYGFGREGEDGNVLTSTDPGDGSSAIWGSLNIAGSTEPGRSLLSVACPTASLCLAASYSGDVFVSTDPQAGAQADWRPAPGRRYVGQVGCPVEAV